MERRTDAYLTHGTDGRAMAKAVLRAANAAALAPGRDALIGLKPNLVLPSPASLGATTHPELAAGAIEYFREEGFSHIVILEGSWAGACTAEAFDACGYRELEKRYGVPLWDTQRDEARERDCAGLRLKVCDCVGRVDVLINLPVMKGHCQTKVTCALKNLKGLIPNSEKRRFHTMGLMKPIAHLAAGIRQDFVLVDALCGDLDFEEGGTPVARNQVLGFFDPVLCDAYACRALGYAPRDVPYLEMAEKLGVGSTDVDAARLHALNSPLAAPDAPASARRVERLAAHADARQACSSCYANLMYALARLEEDGSLERLKAKIAVGQGWRGMSGDVGVGSCTRGFACRAEGCPPTAEEMARTLRELARK